MTFACPHTRELTDDELKRIVDHASKDLEREERKRKKKPPLEGDEWKDQ